MASNKKGDTPPKKSPLKKLYSTLCKTSRTYTTSEKLEAASDAEKQEIGAAEAKRVEEEHQGAGKSKLLHEEDELGDTEPSTSKDLRVEEETEDLIAAGASGKPSEGSALDASGKPSEGSALDASGEPSKVSALDASGEPSEVSAFDASGEPSEGSAMDASGEPSEGSAMDASGNPSEGSALKVSGKPSEGSGLDASEKSSAGSALDSSQNSAEGCAMVSDVALTLGSVQGSSGRSTENTALQADDAVTSDSNKPVAEDEPPKQVGDACVAEFAKSAEESDVKDSAKPDRPSTLPIDDQDSKAQPGESKTPLSDLLRSNEPPIVSPQPVNLSKQDDPVLQSPPPSRYPDPQSPAKDFVVPQDKKPDTLVELEESACRYLPGSSARSKQQVSELKKACIDMYRYQNNAITNQEALESQINSKAPDLKKTIAQAQSLLSNINHFNEEPKTTTLSAQELRAENDKLKILISKSSAVFKDLEVAVQQYRQGIMELMDESCKSHLQMDARLDRVVKILCDDFAGTLEEEAELKFRKT